MLNFSKDYSRKGVVLFVLVLFSGLALRLFGLQNSGHASSEISAYYFAHHLDQIFFTTYQTPAYATLCRSWLFIFPDTPTSLKYLSVTLSLLLGTAASWFLARRKGLLWALSFFTLWWLSPVDIALSRLGFELGLLTEMSVLIFILFHFRKKNWALLSLYQLLHPFALVFVWLLISWEFFKKRFNWHDARFYLSTGLPVLVYYSLRLIFFGKEFIGNLSLYSLGLIPLCGLVFVRNLPRWAPGVLALGLCTFSLLFMRPWKKESGADPSVAFYKSFSKTLDPRESVICASAPELDYYFQQSFSDCSTEVLKRHLKKQSFYFFSLNGDDELLIKFLTENAPISRRLKINQSLFLSVSYPPKT